MSVLNVTSSQLCYHGIKWLPTFGPSQSAWATGLPV